MKTIPSNSQWAIIDFNPISKNDNKGFRYQCMCSCGTIKYVRQDLLFTGLSLKCKDHPLPQPITSHRICIMCYKDLPASMFSKTKKNRSGLLSKCKDCVRDLRNNKRQEDPITFRIKQNEYNTRSKLKNKYNAPVDKIDEIMALKKTGNCAICGMLATQCRNGTLCVDHDHITGEYRGLLCDMHNIGLYWFNDDPALLHAAAEYLKSALHRHVRNS